MSDKEIELEQPGEKAPEILVDAPEVAVVADPQPVKKVAKKALDIPEWIRAEAGDSFMSLAQKYCPPGRAVVLFCSELAKANKYQPIKVGTKIFFPKGK